MTLRIPRPVNRALDAAAHHPRAVLGTALVAFLSVTAVTILTAPLAAWAVGAAFVVYLAVVGHVARVTRLRARLRQTEYDLAAERAANARLRTGDGTAPTVQLRTIGESGEAL